MVILRIPLLCKEGLGEVETGIERRECYAVNSAIDKALPHLNPSLTKGRNKCLE
jgi:hypothetical protein